MWQHAEGQDVANGSAWEPLVRRPRRQASLRLDHVSGPFDAGVATRYVGARPEFGGGTLSPYAVVDLHAGWRFAPQWTARLTADNVFDRRVEPATGYRGRPRSVFASVAWQTAAP